MEFLRKAENEEKINFKIDNREPFDRALGTI